MRERFVQINLGFGNVVESIDYPMNLTSPKEFIFAKKLETVVYREADILSAGALHKIRVAYIEKRQKRSLLRNCGDLLRFHFYRKLFFLFILLLIILAVFKYPDC